MKPPCPLFCAKALRHLVPATLILLSLVGSIRAQVIINLGNSSQQYFAVDAARSFLYVAEASNAPTKRLSVINTLTNTVVGTYTFSSSGYTSQIAASGTDVLWADQGSSHVKVIAVNAAGTPTLTRSDAATLATGVAALAGTYAVSKQGTGDFMDIRLISNGSTSFSSNLGGVAGPVFSDSNTNRYYARSSSSFKVFDASNGVLLGTLSGLVMAIDSASARNFVYLQNGSITTRLDQLTGAGNTVNASYDFGAAFNDVTLDPASGDIFVAQQALNRVVHLNSSMAFVQQFNVSAPQSLAFANGQLYVHGAGTSYLTVIAVPEPATWSTLLGGLGLVFAFWRRRGTRNPT